MEPNEICWETGMYDDDCCCDICDHRHECSASGYDEDQHMVMTENLMTILYDISR